MESQHGLLIERAQKVWSFSHLTFQEYLVAKYVVDNRATQEEVFQQLEVYITKSQGREVFLLTLQLLDNADNFLQAMKCKIDSLLAKDSQFSSFLTGSMRNLSRCHIFIKLWLYVLFTML